METLSKSFKEHKQKFVLLTKVFTVLQYFTGLLVCIAIYKKGSACGYSAASFVASLIMAALGLKYASLVDDPLSYNVNLISWVLHASYIIFYSFYSRNRWRDIVLPLLYAVSIIGVTYTYTEFEHEHKVTSRFGVIMTVALLVVMALPLMNLRQIFEYQDSSYIPCYSVTASFFITVIWIAYSIIVINNFLLIQNVCAAIIALAQIGFCLKYPRRSLEERAVRDYTDI